MFGFEKQSLVLAFAFASAFTLTLEWSWVGKVRVSGRRLTSPLTDKRYGVGVPVTISGLAVFLIDCAGPGMPHADGVAKVMKEEACPTANASSAVPLRWQYWAALMVEAGLRYYSHPQKKELKSAAAQQWPSYWPASWVRNTGNDHLYEHRTLGRHKHQNQHQHRAHKRSRHPLAHSPTRPSAPTAKS